MTATGTAARHLVFDTETTGFKSPRVVEVAVGEFDLATGTLLRHFHSYVRPGNKRVEPGACRLHGLTDRFLATQPTFAEIVRPLTAFLAGGIGMAHNASYDRRMLNLEFDLLDLPPLESVLSQIICTLDMAHRLLPELPGHKLDHLCDHYGIDRRQRTRHGALLDCELLAQVVVRLNAHRPPAPKPALPPVAASVRDPWDLNALSPAVSDVAQVPNPATPTPRKTAPLGWRPGGPWYADEVAALTTGHAQGRSLADLCRAHNRSHGAIVLQLERLGLVSSAEAERLRASAPATPVPVRP